MAVVFPGEAVLDLVRNGEIRVVIAAPYIKSPAVRRLLDVLPSSVSQCLWVTRWLPEDIASGVCDLEIFDDIARIMGGRLFVHPHLHAKYYSNGRRALVGSANVTGRGLGWRTPSNVELLVDLPAEFPGLVDWEAALLESAVEATVQLREQIGSQAEELRRAGPLGHAPEVEDKAEGGERADYWIPQCPAPERLWQVYRGRGADTMVSSAFKAAQEDLAALAPPQGLSEGLFAAYLAGILRQMPLLTEIDKLASTGLTDAKAYEFLAAHLGETGDEVDHHQVWLVVKRWLVHFFPDSYRLETGQEVLVKGKVLPRR